MNRSANAPSQPPRRARGGSPARLPLLLQHPRRYSSFPAATPLLPSGQRPTTPISCSLNMDLLNLSGRMKVAAVLLLRGPRSGSGRRLLRDERMSAERCAWFS
eukprot:COSAG01_NODE_5124_length_4470_cov_10.204987_2_plen_103_part_00